MTQLSFCVFPEHYGIYHFEDVVLKYQYPSGWKAISGLDHYRIHFPENVVSQFGDRKIKEIGSSFLM